MSENEHYLKSELYNLVRTDPAIFDFLQDGSLDGIWYWDVENPKEEWLSPRFKEVFGYQDQEIPNSSDWWQENIHPDDLGVALDNFKKHCEDRKHPYDQVVRYRHKDGSTVWVRCRGMAIRNKDGNPIRLLGAHTDVTALKNAEENLMRKNKELEAFSYSVSHDLRAPLRAIDGFSRILLEEYSKTLDDEGKRMLSVVRENAVRMGQLIDDLLEFSRLGRMPMMKTQVEMAELARDVAKELLGSSRKGNAEIVVEDAPPAMGDVVLIRQVFSNLIGNALKFTAKRDQPHVVVGGRREGAENVYCVKDNGAGFQMEYAHKLFGVFQRLHSENEFEGTGVGLALVERIVHRHGGRVWAEGKVGSGATFSFSLPQEN